GALALPSRRFVRTVSMIVPSSRRCIGPVGLIASLCAGREAAAFATGGRCVPGAGEAAAADGEVGDGAAAFARVVARTAASAMSSIDGVGGNAAGRAEADAGAPALVTPASGR